MLKKCQESTFTDLDSSEKLDMLTEEENDEEEYIPKRLQGRKTLSLQPISTHAICQTLSKSSSTRYDDDIKEIKLLQNNSKFRTFVELRNEKKLSIETKSMLQISDNGLNSMVGQSQNSYNSLTSIDGLYYRNPLENDFEDEELSLEYKTLEYVGQGFHAVVKKVQNTITNEIFAAKITRINDEEIALAINKECAILQKLDHPYILKAFRVIKNPSKSIMTMITEYVDCKNLTVFITKNKKSITETIALKILKKLLIAVEYLHSKYISHRDISPKNILVSDDINIFKLVDFGVSKVYNTGDHIIEMITPTGIPSYQAPEIFRKQKFDEKIDEWSCGHIFYELLKGKHVTSKKLFKLIKEKLLIKNLAEFSEEVRMIVEKLLELNPKKRFSSSECLKNPIFAEL